MSAARLRWLVAALPFVVALGLYAPSIPGAGWVLDDQVNLSRHAHAGDLLGEWTHPTYAWAGGAAGHVWRPLAATLQQLVGLTLGREGQAYRAVNLAVLLGLTALVPVAARRSGASPIVGSLAALVLVLHGVTPEVVAWSSDLFDLLAAVGVVVVLLLCAAERPSPVAIGVATLLAVCSKEAATPLPVVVAAVLVARHGLRAALPATVTSALAVFVWTTAHTALTHQTYADTATAPLASGAAALHVLGALVWLPPGAGTLHAFAPDEVVRGVPGVVAFGLGAALAVVSTARRQVGAALAAIVALSVPAALAIPATGVDPLRYSFVPLAAALVLLPGPIEALPRARFVAGVVFAALLGQLPRTATRAADFQSTAVLAAAELGVEPDAPYARVVLGRALFVEHRAKEDAVRLWSDALADLPASVRIVDRRSETWDLAQATFLVADYAEALVLADRVRAFGPPFPDQLGCLRADALDGLGRHDDAEDAARDCPNARLGGDPEAQGP